MLLNGCGSADNRVLEETFERVYTIEPSARLTIQNRDGVVSIYGSETGEMRIDAVKKAYSHKTRRHFNYHEISSQANLGAVRPLRHGRLHDRCPGNRRNLRN